jgi:TIR domain
MTRTPRVAVAAAAMLAALALDLWLLRRPEPHSVAEFNPFVSKQGKEELIVKGVAIPSGPLLSHQGVSGESVDIFFDQGVLAGQSKHLPLPWAQSDQPQAVAYTTIMDADGMHGDPCRTFVKVATEKSDHVPEVRFFQLDVPGGAQHREIEFKSMNSRLTVDFLTQADDSTQLNQPGCRKLLQVGAGQVPIVGFPLSIVAAAGSSVRLKFLPTSQKPLWAGKNGGFLPFEALNLRAQSVLVSPIGSKQELRGVESTDGLPSISVDTLKVGSQDLQALVSGVGLVTVNDALVGPTLKEWVAAGTGRATIVGLFNLSVILGAAFFALRPQWSAVKFVRRPGLEKPPVAPGLLQVFLCHCSEDKPAVRALFKQLETDGFQPWLDEEDLPPSMPWNDQIHGALQSSHAVAICLTKVFEHKEGYIQKELRDALDLAKYKLPGAVFLIPARLEECEIPSSLSDLQCIDLYAPGGYDKLKLALHKRARQLGIESLTPRDATV